MLSVILLSMLMILLSTLDMIRHLICGNNLNWLLNLILIYETLGWGRKWLVNFSARKTQLVSFDRLTTLLLLMWKWMGLFLKKNHCWICWGWLLDWGSYMISNAKTASEKLELWFVLWSFFLLGLLCISINLPYAHVWNTVVTSGLFSLAKSESQFKKKAGVIIAWLHSLGIVPWASEAEKSKANISPTSLAHSINTLVDISPEPEA